MDMLKFVMANVYQGVIQLVSKRSDENLKQRRQLCEDLDYLIREDKAIREEIIDEYVYLLNDKRLVELQEYVKQELYADH